MIIVSSQFKDTFYFTPQVLSGGEILASPDIILSQFNSNPPASLPKTALQKQASFGLKSVDIFYMLFSSCFPVIERYFLQINGYF